MDGSGPGRPVPNHTPGETPMFKRTKHLSALIAAISFIAISGNSASAAPPSSLDEWPIVTIGEILNLDEDQASFYIRGMLDTAAYAMLSTGESHVVARCITDQEGEIRAMLADVNMGKRYAMFHTGMIVSEACQDGTLTGGKDLTWTEEFDKRLGSASDYYARTLYLLGSRDYLLAYLATGLSEEQKACISDTYVAGFDDVTTFASEAAKDTSGALVRPVVATVLFKCLE